MNIISRNHECYIVVKFKLSSNSQILEVNLYIDLFEIKIVIFIYIYFFNKWFGKIKTAFRHALAIFVIKSILKARMHLNFDSNFNKIYIQNCIKHIYIINNTK